MPSLLFACPWYVHSRSILDTITRSLGGSGTRSFCCSGYHIQSTLTFRKGKIAKGISKIVGGSDLGMEAEVEVDMVGDEFEVDAEVVAGDKIAVELDAEVEIVVGDEIGVEYDAVFEDEVVAEDGNY